MRPPPLKADTIPSQLINYIKDEIYMMSSNRCLAMICIGILSALFMPNKCQIVQNVIIITIDIINSNSNICDQAKKFLLRLK